VGNGAAQTSVRGCKQVRIRYVEDPDGFLLRLNGVPSRWLSGDWVQPIIAGRRRGANADNKVDSKARRRGPGEPRRLAASSGSDPI
jgi:hypothetical protein